MMVGQHGRKGSLAHRLEQFKAAFAWSRRHAKLLVPIVGALTGAVLLVYLWGLSQDAEKRKRG